MLIVFSAWVLFRAQSFGVALEMLATMVGLNGWELSAHGSQFLWLIALPGSRAAVRYRECKRRLANLAASAPNRLVVGFMIPLEITSHDENYWDDRHEDAREIGALLISPASSLS